MGPILQGRHDIDQVLPGHSRPPAPKLARIPSQMPCVTVFPLQRKCYLTGCRTGLLQTGWLPRAINGQTAGTGPR